MISHIWTVIARSTIVDASTNLISLQNVLEKIDVDIQGSVPENSNLVVPIDFEIATLWTDDETEKRREFSVKIQLIDTENKVSGEFDQSMALEKSIRRFRSILKVSGLPITKSGIYYFRINIKSEKEKKFKEITQIPLEVNIAIHPLQNPAQS